MIEFKDLEEQYVKEAIVLAIQEYQEECNRCSSLVKDNFMEAITDIVQNVFENKHGKVALENNKVIGYLAFGGPWEGFHGNAKGVFSPLGASAFSGENKGRLASMLFERAAQDMIQEGITSFGISRFLLDDEIDRAFVLNGFGIRCSDAVMKLSERNVVKQLSTDLEFTELKKEHKSDIEQLKHQLTYHLAAAPCFFPTNLECFDEWFHNDNIQIIAVKKSQKIIGYMALSDEGETYISEHKSMYNICGAYVDKEYRKEGIAQQLLEYICRKCEKEGMEYLGVDCETLNPTALHFWGKYFDNYTYSYVRRIDERVLGYKQYLDEIWK